MEYIDINLHGDNIGNNVIDSPLDLFFQEVEIAINTGPNEIWGVAEAINLSRYLFNKYVTLTQITNEITSYVNKNCQHAIDFDFKVNAEIVKIKEKELIYIPFIVYVDGQEFTHKYLLGS